MSALRPGAAAGRSRVGLIAGALKRLLVFRRRGGLAPQVELQLIADPLYGPGVNDPAPRETK
jgi:hypothetical protein